MFEGIIYELDGLLIDTDLIHIQAWQEYLERFELPLSEYELNDLISRRVYDAAEYLYRRYGIPEDPFTIFEKRQEIFMKHLENNLEPLPGAIESLQMFKDYDFKLAVTCTGPRDYVYYVTEALGLEEAFDVIVAGDMISEGYPNPTMLVACGETFALHPSYCLSLTSRREGVEASTNARMKSICVPGRTTPRWRVMGADLVLPSLSDLNFSNLRSLWTESSDEPQPFPFQLRS